MLLLFRDEKPYIVLPFVINLKLNNEISCLLPFKVGCFHFNGLKMMWTNKENCCLF